MHEIAAWLDLRYFIGALDILLVSYLIYRILLMVKGTRALPMLAGLGVIVVVFVVSREIGLVTLNWILGNFLGSAILVIVVLFQDDLRRALIRVGLGPGLGNSNTSEHQHTIKEVAKAAAELSSRRLGALLVIKRDVGLEEYTEQAVKIDGVVSSELLISIFLPTSPIHDGAIILSGNRVLAAGAVLPLTFERSTSRSLGTRHRAGLGLSERSDALVVVVSEETGIISLIREGRITRDLNETTLYNALHRLTVARDELASNRGWRRFLRKSSSGSGAAVDEAASADVADSAAEQ
ncbi:MAG: diadenylate cyclase CdaA [Bdellovibrionales bacterium]|nr:diadenylate cyclase CdaA [Bdellovibrionales bacterium]